MKTSQRLRFHLSLAVLIVIAGITAASTTSGPQTEGYALLLRAIWRSGGNSFVELTSAANGSRIFTVELFGDRPEDYPVPAAGDKAFYTKASIDERFHAAATLQSFKLLCGIRENEAPITTTLVFWSSDHWEGSKQVVQCSATNNHEVTGPLTVTNAQSFCVVTDRSRADRRSRCINGPRCDDAMRNGTESDTDCGGSCSTCGVGRQCNSGSDCYSQSCPTGTCRAPSCSDGVRNQNESDTDCGGSCTNCAVNQRCNGNSDCDSSFCQSGRCQIRPTCSGAPSTSAAHNRTVYVERINQCAYVTTYFANSLSEAQQCARANSLTPVAQICPYSMNIGENWYPYVEASSDSHAIACTRNTVCGNCSITVAERGNCASQP